MKMEEDTLSNMATIERSNIEAILPILNDLVVEVQQINSRTNHTEKQVSELCAHVFGRKRPHSASASPLSSPRLPNFAHGSLAASSTGSSFTHPSTSAYPVKTCGQDGANKRARLDKGKQVIKPATSNNPSLSGSSTKRSSGPFNR